MVQLWVIFQVTGIEESNLMHQCKWIFTMHVQYLKYCPALRVAHRQVLLQAPFRKDPIELWAQGPLCQNGEHHTLLDQGICTLSHTHTKLLNPHCH